jgi:hypothetical protein
VESGIIALQGLCRGQKIKGVEVLSEARPSLLRAQLSQAQAPLIADPRTHLSEIFQNLGSPNCRLVQISNIEMPLLPASLV